MHIYAFGSVCRGEISQDSDVDLLVLTNKDEKKFLHDTYSVYTYKRIHELWLEGSPFAWHLHHESRIVFSDDNEDYLKKIGAPSKYKNFDNDFAKFHTLMVDAINRVNQGTNSVVFEISNIFLAIRNISICYSIDNFEKPIFSRHAAIMLSERSLKLPQEVYHIFERARILSTRGIGDNLLENEVSLARSYFNSIQQWAMRLKLAGDRNA